MSRDKGIIQQIVEACEAIELFRGGHDKKSFLHDRKTRSAVLHQLLIIGEASKRLSEGFRSEQPNIPWKAMAGMRDKLIHGYDDVDFEIVWRTISTEIPNIGAVLKKLL